MLKKAMSCTIMINDEEFFKELKDAGIEAIEISLKPNDVYTLDYQAVLENSKKYGIELWSYHLPFWGLGGIDIASHDEKIRENTLKVWFDLIEKGVQIGIKTYIVHPSCEPKSEDEATRNQEINYAMDCLKILAEKADKHGARIAVEDLPRSCLGRNSKELLKLISVDDRIGVCFDTNHLLKQDLFEFIDEIHDKIITLHVSDYDYVDERHWLPGEGKIDWHKLYNKLIDYGYNGPWLYEIAVKTLPNDINRSRELTVKDLSINASEIFSGSPLTLI